MERGANTFPFHNLLPYSKSNEGLFLFFSPSLNWIKEKSVATLAICTFAIQKSQSQFTVLQNWRLCWGDDFPEDYVDVNTIRISSADPVPRVAPLIITSPRPVPYSSDKAIPWSYG